MGQTLKHINDILYLALRRYEPVDTSGRAALKAPEKKDLGHFVDF